MKNLKSNKLFPLLFTTIVVISGILGNTVFAGKISDYSFKDNEDNVIVANRSATKQIALTFDDGPSKKYTQEILEILKQYNAKATFFVVGKNAKDNPQIILEEYSAGHEIGNHTYSHPNLRGLSPEKVDEEIFKTQEIIKEITGEYPTLFRPPGGYLSNDIVDKIASNNCKTVLWSWRQDTKDWTSPSADTIVNSVLTNLKDGDIILFHDYNSKKSPTPDALRKLLPVLKEKGYEFVTVSELVKI